MFGLLHSKKKLSVCQYKQLEMYATYYLYHDPFMTPFVKIVPANGVHVAVHAVTGEHYHVPHSYEPCVEVTWMTIN